MKEKGLQFAWRAHGASFALIVGPVTYISVSPLICVEIARERFFIPARLCFGFSGINTGRLAALETGATFLSRRMMLYVYNQIIFVNINFEGIRLIRTVRARAFATNQRTRPRASDMKIPAKHRAVKMAKAMRALVINCP